MKAMRVGKDSPSPGSEIGAEFEGREAPDSSSERVISKNDMIYLLSLVSAVSAN
jgi:hypothetical protein